ncbi:hypothetical protein PAESOLCIP111_03066 [Paenibacillus solanacearum]|uniref:Extracellular solute-binding protein n=1 Tax=Paenibacillus solanacearum TaxID=2048548 RepID=A0A916K4I8_9BACL|nr:extracellular solute-binding protein [Paenibacillus solanacearum]CAG7629059.1 hypothetical protein PAESOLCIP111_03066 [Paenibacillus solanacearum]
MNGTRKLALLLGMSMIGTLVLSGCSGGKTASPGADAKETPRADAYNNEPVTLTFYSQSAGVLNQSDLDALVTKPVQAKYPNITTQLLTGRNLETLITAGETPDIVLSSNVHMLAMIQLGLGSDLRDFIKQEKIDMNLFEPETINTINGFSDKGEIFGLPFGMNYGMMLYNKDIFDKFAAPYPKDGMTWNQVIDLARKVTKLDGGTQYVGLDLQGPSMLLRPYGLSVVDEKQEKAALQTDGFKKVLGLYQQNFAIPGNVEPQKRYTYGIDYFLKDQKVAMMPYWLAATYARLPQLQEPGKGFNWDVVSFPSYEEKPGIGREIDFHLAMVTPTSKNKKAAYAVVKTIVGEEAQKAMNRGSRMTVLKDPALKKEVAADSKLYDGKNLQGIFKVKPAPLPKTSKYDSKIYSYLSDAAKSMAFDKTDINTVLRTAEEIGTKYIQENK